MDAYISVIAPKYQLPPQLVSAIVLKESGGDRFAMRVEPAYPYLWDVARNQPYKVSTSVAADRNPAPLFNAPRGHSIRTEWIGQQTSWGLMQIMGAVARELGFTGFFPALCDPMTGLDYGCRHLAALIKRFSATHGLRGAVAAYNAGSPRYQGTAGRFENQDYVDAVERLGGFKGL
ncbi:lytic transglycosylase domain-containing protein [Solimonas flava]|uniref:lytic transglycosylase domain-containing protein n=1 Tax=Solimonas flava TaxID=415849 RepID=UPI001378CF25|nr:lytic transglycosylase domain-containing protein [Solimonas flava]